MSNVYEGCEKIPMPKFLAGPGLKDALKRIFKSNVALHFNHVFFTKVLGRVGIKSQVRD